MHVRQLVAVPICDARNDCHCLSIWLKTQRKINRLSKSPWAWNTGHSGLIPRFIPALDSDENNRRPRKDSVAIFHCKMERRRIRHDDDIHLHPGISVTEGLCHAFSIRFLFHLGIIEVRVIEGDRPGNTSPNDRFNYIQEIFAVFNSAEQAQYVLLRRLRRSRTVARNAQQYAQQHQQSATANTPHPSRLALSKTRNLRRTPAIAAPVRMSRQHGCLHVSAAVDRGWIKCAPAPHYFDLIPEVLRFYPAAGLSASSIVAGGLPTCTVFHR